MSSVMPLVVPVTVPAIVTVAPAGTVRVPEGPAPEVLELMVTLSPLATVGTLPPTQLWLAAAPPKGMATTKRMSAVSSKIILMALFAVILFVLFAVVLLAVVLLTCEVIGCIIFASLLIRTN